MDYLAHHGIKGMRWGYRRWQNPDGTLTEEGKKHYGKGLAKVVKTHREKKIRSTKQDIADYDSALRDPQLRQKLSAAKANAQSDLAAYETAASKEQEVAYNRAYAKADFREAFKTVKKSGYFDDFPKEVRNGLLKAGRTSRSIEDFDKKTLEKYGDHAADVLYDEVERIKHKRQSALRSTASGKNYAQSINRAIAINQISQQHLQQQFIQQSIVDANRAMSISMTCGMNPYMFG